MAYRLTSDQKRDLGFAVDAIADNNPGTGVLPYPSSLNWAPVHGCKTSQMEGYKLGCRQNSTAPFYMWVGLCPCSGKTMHPRPVVEVCFAQVPTTNVLVDALRRAIQQAS